MWAPSAEMYGFLLLNGLSDDHRYSQNNRRHGDDSRHLPDTDRIIIIIVLCVGRRCGMNQNNNNVWSVTSTSTFVSWVRDRY